MRENFSSIPRVHRCSVSHQPSEVTVDSILPGPLELLMQINMQSDLAAVDATLKAMYAAISFSEDGEPDDCS